MLASSAFFTFLMSSQDEPKKCLLLMTWKWIFEIVSHEIGATVCPVKVFKSNSHQVIMTRFLSPPPKAKVTRNVTKVESGGS